MGHLTTAQIGQISEDPQRDGQRTSDVARIASELQRQVPGLCRTEALKMAENAIPHTI